MEVFVVPVEEMLEPFSELGLFHAAPETAHITLANPSEMICVMASSFTFSYLGCLFLPSPCAGSFRSKSNGVRTMFSCP